MRISCPHCNASYEVKALIKNAVLVCHRCHAEFSMDEKPVDTGEEPAATVQDQSLPLFEHVTDEQAAPEKDQGGGDSSVEEGIPAFLAGSHDYYEQIKKENLPLPEPSAKRWGGERHDWQTASDLDAVRNVADLSPESESKDVWEDEPDVTSYMRERSDIAIWPWLIVVLLVIGSVGFWYKKDAWLDDPWFRSVLINLYLPVEVRDKDWFIIPKSVQGRWLKRDDGSQVLVIQGRIENLLYRDLPPPRILVRFFDDTGITDSLGEKLMPITEPPSMDQVRHAPFVTPRLDSVPVEAQGQRGFFLVLEELPQRTADFTLSPVVGKK